MCYRTASPWTRLPTPIRHNYSRSILTCAPPTISSGTWGCSTSCPQRQCWRFLTPDLGVRNCSRSSMVIRRCPRLIKLQPLHLDGPLTSLSQERDRATLPLLTTVTLPSTQPLQRSGPTPFLTTIR